MTDMNREKPIAAGTTGWATETLKEYTDARFEALKELVLSLMRESDARYEQRFKDQQTAVEAALVSTTARADAAQAAATDAVLKAEGASEKRFEGVNEFRATLADQQRTLMPRLEAEQRMKTLEERIAKTESALITASGAKTGGKELWAIITAVLGVGALVYGLTR